MTDAELLESFLGFAELTNQLFFGYVSLLSGFLVMSYLVANKISGFLASISVTLFTLVSALLVFGIFFGRNNSGQIMVVLRERSLSAEHGVGWLGSNPPWAADLLSVLYVLASIGGYLASVTYFFYKRVKQNEGDFTESLGS